jgi:hypothetical protein
MSKSIPQPKKAEPRILLRGKKFHSKVQKAYLKTSDIVPLPEHGFLRLSGRKGRIDLLIAIDDFTAALIEIKSTAWDKVVLPRNIRRHARQVWTYVDAAMELSGYEDITPTVIYPRLPSRKGLRREVEFAFAQQGIAVFWWAEQEGTPEEVIDDAEAYQLAADRGEVTAVRWVTEGALPPPIAIVAVDIEAASIVAVTMRNNGLEPVDVGGWRLRSVTVRDDGSTIDESLFLPTAVVLPGGSEHRASISPNASTSDRSDAIVETRLSHGTGALQLRALDDLLVYVLPLRPK